MTAAGTGTGSTWTTRRLLQWMTGHFAGRGVQPPRVVAEMLLAHVLGCERLRLYMEADRPASPLERAALRELVARASAHEPVQYLVGEAWFFGRPFHVQPGVFIPRPCTEMLIEHVLRWTRAEPGHVRPLVADVGTGSGCLAVTLAVQLPGAHVVATDVDGLALEVARRNAERHEVADRIELRRGAGLEPLGHRDGGYDVIVSNPPYVSEAAWGGVAPNVRDYEPTRALRAGADGLDVIRPLVGGAAAQLAPGGQLVLEFGDDQKDAVLELAAEAPGLVDAAVSRDHEGLWRMLVARKKRRSGEATERRRQ